MPNVVAHSLCFECAVVQNELVTNSEVSWPCVPFAIPHPGTTDLKYLMVPYMLAEAGAPKRSAKGELGCYVFIS